MNSYNACLLAMFRLVHREQKKPRMIEHLAPHIVCTISSREIIHFTYNKTLAQHTECCVQKLLL
jgi:hypothetical protein